LAIGEAAIRRRHNVLAISCDVAISTQAHGAPWQAPVETGIHEDPVQTFGFGLSLD
jgi:hypothetical protein